MRDNSLPHLATVCSVSAVCLVQFVKLVLCGSHENFFLKVQHFAQFGHLPLKCAKLELNLSASTPKHYFELLTLSKVSACPV